MYLIEYILTRVKKQKLTPSKNSSLWMKNFTKKHLQMEQLPWWWSASLSICSSYKQERYCLEVLTWNLVFEVAQRASIVFLNTLFILNSSAILLHKILNFEFSTLEPKNIVVGNFPPIGNPRQQIVWLVRSFIIFQRMIHQTNLT